MSYDDLYGQNSSNCDNNQIFTLRQGEIIICPIDRKTIARGKVSLKSVSLLLVQPEYWPGEFLNMILFGNMQNSHKIF